MAETYKKLSVLIPVYNEKYTVGKCIEKVLKAKAEELGIDLWVHVQNVIDAMRLVASELGLAGTD